jgi:hypothetical protein
MIRTELVQAARRTADHYRQTGALPHPEPESPAIDTRPALEVVRMRYVNHSNGTKIMLCVCQNIRKYDLTLKGYQWLDDNPEAI